MLQLSRPMSTITRSFIAIMLVLPIVGFGQLHEAVFPDLQGEALFEALQLTYTPDSVLTYSMARDTLFSKVYQESDSLECVYSGWKRYLDPELDPTQAVFTNNGDNEDINTEHCYPQSKGASVGNGRSDMHHLFPTRVTVNSDRANDPFMEIDDDVTVKWFYKNLTLTSEPNSMKERYAEDIFKGFEPREGVKGNVARAIFYFYTIYRDNAVSADPSFFDVQRVTLCNWHFEDKVDQKEWDRTHIIATYQEDKPNPYVLDCTLAERMYCDDVIIQDCTVSSNFNVHPEDSSPWILYPNPGTNILRIQSPSKWSYADLFNQSGEMIKTVSLSQSGSYQVSSDITPLPAGIYFVRLCKSTSGGCSDFQKWIKR